MNSMPDSGKIAAAFHQKAVEYDHHVLVQKRVAEQLVRSVGFYATVEPQHILDVGTGTGSLLERLHVRYPAACLTGVDIALNMCVRTAQKMGAACHVVNANAECLPFKTGVFDLIVSASVLQWVENLSAALHEMHRVVKPGGDINIAFFCDGTLGELQHCFRDAMGRYRTDSTHNTSRLHDFWTVDDVKQIVDSMEFDKVVVTVETEVDWYNDLHSLLRSIKNIGAGTVAGGSVRGLGWRGILQEASQLYQNRYGQNGKIPATYKVLYLSARTR